MAFNPIKYVQETRGELKHVSWPTRRQALQFTGLVILISIIVSILLGVFDYIFGEILQLFI
ncbi:preprotein translocase subunit SecE [bacterium]|nr:preprotein translocase subunit SecE [bacterium]